MSGWAEPALAVSETSWPEIGVRCVDCEGGEDWTVLQILHVICGITCSDRKLC